MTWLLPTRGRIDNLRRFCNTAREMGTNTPGWVIVDKDDWEANLFAYKEVKNLLPLGWDFVTVEPQGYGGALRQIWARVKDMKWVGLVSDDLVPSSMNWDKTLVSSLSGWNFVSAMNGFQDQRMHGATAWSGDLLRAIGWLFPPDLKHVFHDDVWETIGRDTGAWRIMPGVMTKHLHEAYLTGHRGPTMDPTSALFRHDKAVYEAWVANDKERCIAAVRGLMDRHGVVAMKPDFTGVTLMIATPTIDGKYESGYMGALYKTMEFMRQNGVGVMVAEEKYTADITLSRNKIFSTFYRSPCSHLLMIDADMGWEVDAVSRLFCAKKEFASVAGPKKKYPLQFAANHTDARGNPITLVFDATSGTMEVSEIGSAFAMITRGCAERLVQGYPDLAYLGTGGEAEWNFFAPMISGNRYYSEDFAFCRRWRAIGGQVYMLPDVRLSHTGAHTFTGAFIETQQPAEAVIKDLAAE